MTAELATKASLKRAIDEAAGAPGPSPLLIVDARSSGRFDGSAPEPRPNLPSGHMPGARSVPFDSLLDGEAGTMLPPERLADVFARAGVRTARRVRTGRSVRHPSPPYG